jgi:hypothetical protein
VRVEHVNAHEDVRLARPVSGQEPCPHHKANPRQGYDGPWRGFCAQYSQLAEHVRDCEYDPGDERG